MKFDKDLLKEKWAAYTVALCSAVVLYMVLTHLNVLGHLLAGIWKIGSPVFMALVIAYVMAPLVDMYSKYVLHRVEQEKLRHTLSVLLAVLSVVLFFVILMVAPINIIKGVGISALTMLIYKKISPIIKYGASGQQSVKSSE